ncbi:MAG: YdiU family protein [Rhodocyclaceae bacterium]
MRHPEHAPTSFEALPFDNSFARLPGDFYTRLAPEGLPDPKLLAVSAEASALIGLSPDSWAHAEAAEYFSGNRPLPGSEPLAAVYSGHQFGVWAGQLGDGRAHLLGAVQTPDGPMELQLKGAGQTPYSRRADGRAVLRSSIREFLCSEAMAALGIPTTRALCLVGSPQPVRRETMETAAIVTRMAPSFVRFGSFEHWASRDRFDELKTLADYVIDHFRPALRDEAEPYAALLADVARNTAIMIAHWQAIGFMHGVMNTDNMSILGLTLDYGPFGFMEAFDATHICNHSDEQGRYAFHRQPAIAHWNLYALGGALASLIGEHDKIRDLIDGAYIPTYEQKFMQLACSKLGLAEGHESDEDLLRATYGLLQDQRIDHTIFFRALSSLPAQVTEAERASIDAPLRDHFIDREAGDAWLAQWRTRLTFESRNDADRQQAMLATNPQYVLRNWMAEGAIVKARQGDYSEIARVLDCLRQPFTTREGFEDFAKLPPDWASGLEVSCSS